MRLINAWAQAAQHALVSGDSDRRSAAQLLDRKAAVSWPEFPSLTGKPWLGRLNRMAAAMKGYDLICTYNWGAIDGVMAHMLFGEIHQLAPLVHHEDGFNEDEAGKLKWQRNYFRAIALGRAAAFVVPSHVLEDIALGPWKQPRSRVRRIPNGIATSRFAESPSRDLLRGLTKPQGNFWVGTLAGLRKVKQLDALIRAMREMPENWQLVIAGEGPERAALTALARELGLAGRVHLPGFVAEPAKIVGLFDIFALSSRSEQQPISVIEAMAAGLPVVAPRVGDIGRMVASDNGPALVDPADLDTLAASLGASLGALAGDRDARIRIGTANRAKAIAEFDEKRMIERYGALYWSLMDRAKPPALA